jgi:hypothetical protein
MDRLDMNHQDSEVERERISKLHALMADGELEGLAAESGGNVHAPQANQEQLIALQQKTEQYCVMMRTLLKPPKIENTWILQGPRN